MINNLETNNYLKSISLTKKYLINGPNNVVRLTDGTKILYIFGDYHIPINVQNECYYNKEYDSRDIDKFMYKFIKNNKDIKYDIFCEMTEDDSYISQRRDIYIENFRNLRKFIINDIKN